MFVNLAEDIGGQHGELVGTVRIIEAADNSLEGGIVDLEFGREIVGRLDPISFFLKIEQTGVVTLVRFPKELI